MCEVGAPRHTRLLTVFRKISYFVVENVFVDCELDGFRTDCVFKFSMAEIICELL